MTSPARQSTRRSTATVMSKVPEVTIFFWIIKILCTTVGESAADYLNYNLNWGLTGTSIATGILLAVVLAWQMSLRRYVAGVYWLTVVLVSVFGTLVTDNMTDHAGVPLVVSTVGFSLALGVVFLAWFLVEHTLSIHSIYTRGREAFYWLAVLVTFALGTAAGDLVSEGLGVGYLRTGLLCAALIAIVTIAWRLGLNAVLAFWIAYILTRPLGASIGDFLAQPSGNGGLGLGVALTSVIFLGAILLVVAYLSIRKPDVITIPTGAQERALLDDPETAPHHRPQSRRSAVIQTAVVLTVLVVGGGAFYAWRSAALDAEAAQGLPGASVTPGRASDSGPTGGAAGSGSASVRAYPLGDMSSFSAIAQDTLVLLQRGQQDQATARITDLESAWDTSQATLQRRDSDEWHTVDGLIDTVLRQLRATRPDVPSEEAALQALLDRIGG